MLLADDARQVGRLWELAISMSTMMMQTAAMIYVQSVDGTGHRNRLGYGGGGR